MADEQFDDEGNPIVTIPEDGLGDGALDGPPSSDPYNSLAGDTQDKETRDLSSYVDPETGITVKNGLDYVTPEGTITGQLEGILSGNSPLMKLNQTRSREQAAALGMSSSSGAIGAGQRALYDYAMPIAKADAESVNKFMGTQQGIEGELDVITKEGYVSGALAEHGAKLGIETTQEDNFWALRLKGLEVMTDEDKAEYIHETEQTMTILQGGIDKDIQADGLAIKGNWSKIRATKKILICLL